MSLELSGLGLVANQQNNTDIVGAIQLLIREIKLLRLFSPQPFIFAKSNSGLSSNVSEDVLIFQGQPVPDGHRATVRDFNLIFTTAAGTVKIVVLDKNGVQRQEILRDITSSTNGVGETVLEEGERLAVVGQTAGVGGTFEIFCTGSKQAFREDLI